jgi:glycoprotein endo-alpha-1,2-mannosidase
MPVVVFLVLAAAAPAAAAPLTIGAYYYSWFTSAGGHWDDGFARGRLTVPELPALGEYDSRDPGVIAQQYAWAQQYGVDVFFCSWTGPGSYEDGTVRDDLLPSPARGSTRIAILYESLQRFPLGSDNLIHIDAAAIAKLVGDFDYLARTYFDDPGYYRIDGRPVVVLYASRIYRGEVAQAIEAVREHLETAYGIDPYLIGDEVDWNDPPDPERIKLFDAITGYTLYSESEPAGWPSRTAFLQTAGERMREFQEVAEAEGVGFVPGSLPGFNDRGTRLDANHHVLPRALGPAPGAGSLFAGSLQLAGSLVDPALDLMTVTSWNEWQEDTQIEPTAAGAASDGPDSITQGYPYAPYGLSLLQALAQFKLGWQQPRAGPATGAATALRAGPRTPLQVK